MLRKIVDSFGRVHTNLRVSVTDRCNIRCFYCMPDENLQFLPHDKILTFEEITRFVRVASELGVEKIRITGGEPLVRRELEKLIEMIAEIPAIRDIALTTNGVLLANQAEKLKRAGLNRINISLDTLNEDTFEKISRRKGLQKVLEGIDAAIDANFDKIRLNAIAIAGLTETETISLVKFARDKNLEIRFIEFMPLDAEQNWQTQQVLSGAKLRQLIESELGELVESQRPDPSQPAIDFEFKSGGGKVGFINPVSEPFCQNCNRLRLTAEGNIRNCLFSIQEFDAKSVLRSSESKPSEIANLILQCVQQKKATHGIDSDGFERPDRAMYQIGG